MKKQFLLMSAILCMIISQSFSNNINVKFAKPIIVFKVADIAKPKPFYFSNLLFYTEGTCDYLASGSGYFEYNSSGQLTNVVFTSFVVTKQCKTMLEARTDITVSGIVTNGVYNVSQISSSAFQLSANCVTALDSFIELYVLNNE